MIPYVRANECLKYHFENKIPIDEWTQTKQKLEGMKKGDPKGINKGGVVEIDEFIDQILA